MGKWKRICKNQKVLDYNCWVSMNNSSLTIKGWMDSESRLHRWWNILVVSTLLNSMRTLLLVDRNFQIYTWVVQFSLTLPISRIIMMIMMPVIRRMYKTLCPDSPSTRQTIQSTKCVIVIEWERLKVMLKFWNWRLSMLILRLMLLTLRPRVHLCREWRLLLLLLLIEWIILIELLIRHWSWM